MSGPRPRFHEKCQTVYWPVEEEISTTGPTDFEEILILTQLIGPWKTNSIPKTLPIFSKFRHHTTWNFDSISIFYSVAYPSHFPFCMCKTYNPLIWGYSSKMEHDPCR